jgi:hypothetical protein
LVPDRFREDFVFHASAIWNDPKYRRDWSMTDRFTFRKAMMGSPRRLGTTQEPEMRVFRTRRSIRCVEKGDDPILQLSDASAFGLRRYFSGEESGNDFASAILGSELKSGDFSGRASGDNFVSSDEKQIRRQAGERIHFIVTSCGDVWGTESLKTTHSSVSVLGVQIRGIRS